MRFSIILLYIALSAGLANASDVDEQKIINEALRHYKNGNTELSLQKIQPLVKTNPKAMYNLAVIYSFGKKPILRPEVQKLRAFQLFEKAALHGYVPAMYMLATRFKLGIGTKKNPEAAIKWLKMAADKAHVQACYELAVVYYKGMDGMPVDYALSLRYLKLAARQNHVKAQSLIGYMYAVGEGTSPDKETALEWLQRAADKNDLVAQINVTRLINQSDASHTNESDQYWTLR